MMTPVVNCKIIDFPVKGNEMVMPNEDGSYTILINARLSQVGRIKAYEHAIKHILSDDFEKYDVQEIERETHS